MEDSSRRSEGSTRVQVDGTEKGKSPETELETIELDEDCNASDATASSSSFLLHFELKIGYDHHNNAKNLVDC